MVLFTHNLLSVTGMSQKDTLMVCCSNYMATSDYLFFGLHVWFETPRNMILMTLDAGAFKKPLETRGRPSVHFPNPPFLSHNRRKARRSRKIDSCTRFYNARPQFLHPVTSDQPITVLLLVFMLSIHNGCVREERL